MKLWASVWCLVFLTRSVVALHLNDLLGNYSIKLNRVWLYAICWVTAVFISVDCRCPYLTVTYSIGIPVYQSVIAIFVIMNFGLATFMDPGLYPRGRYSLMHSLEFRLRMFNEIHVTNVAWNFNSNFVFNVPYLHVIATLLASLLCS